MGWKCYEIRLNQRYQRLIKSQATSMEESIFIKWSILNGRVFKSGIIYDANFQVINLDAINFSWAHYFIQVVLILDRRADDLRWPTWLINWLINWLIACDGPVNKLFMIMILVKMTEFATLAQVDLIAFSGPSWLILIFSHPIWVVCVAKW